MKPMSAAVKRIGNHPLAIARFTLAAVAVGWGLFAAMATVGEPWIAYVWAGALIALLGGLAALGWARARWAGALAIGAAVAGAWYFKHPAPFLLMTAPLAGAGVILLWHGAPRVAQRPSGGRLDGTARGPEATPA